MSETLQRIISGFSLVIIFVFAFTYEGLQKIPFYLLVSGMALLGQLEFYKMVKKNADEKAFPVSGIILGQTLLLIVFLYSLKTQYLPGFLHYNAAIRSVLDSLSIGFPFIFFLFFLSIVYLLVRELTRRHLQGSFYSISVTLAGIIYVPLTFSHMFLLESLPHGTFYIWLVSWATFMTDTFAYFAGKFLGKHKVGFGISPNKTWEGYLGGLIGSAGTLPIYYYFADKSFTVPDIHMATIILIGVILFAMATLGDLSESLLKRNAGVKDSGKIIPGHGGILDLLDALMFTIPAGYYVILFIQYISQ